MPRRGDPIGPGLPDGERDAFVLFFFVLAAIALVLAAIFIR